MICKICSAASDPFARARLLSKYDIQYFQCPACGFVQTEEPYWLDEAYTEPITNSDLGLVSRNLSLSRRSQSIISALFRREAKFMDYGGGYGLFVRLMRDSGFDFYRYDKFSPNLFAEGFDADIKLRDQYELVTAFEVFEHFLNPRDELEKILAFSHNILFSTILVPPSKPKPEEWWYYGLDHGQHLALYTRKALKILAEKYRLLLYSDGKSLHLLSEKKIPPALFSVVSRYKFSLMIGALSRKSLLADDYFRLTGKHLNL